MGDRQPNERISPKISISLRRRSISIENQPTLLAALWRNKWQILVVAVLAAMLGGGLSALQTPVFRAEGTVIITDPTTARDFANEVGLGIDRRRHMKNVGEVMASAAVARVAADIMGSPTTPLDVQSSTVVTVRSDRDVISISAVQPSAGKAVDMVNAMVEAYRLVVTEQIQVASSEAIAMLRATAAGIEDDLADIDIQIAGDQSNSALKAQRASLTRDLTAITKRVATVTVATETYNAGIRLYVAPEAPKAPIRPSPPRNAIILFILGGIGSSVWAWRRYTRLAIVDDQHAPAHSLGSPLLGTVDVTGATPSIEIPDEDHADTHGSLLTAIQVALAPRTQSVVLISSSKATPASAAIALQIAATAIRKGLKPLLVDANVEHRALTDLSDRQDTLGLTDIGEIAIDEVGFSWEIDPQTTIDFVPAGTRNDDGVATLMRSQAFEHALGTLATDYDLVLIESAPLVDSAESREIAAIADGVVIIVSPDTSQQELINTRQHVSLSGGRIIGYLYEQTLRSVPD